MDAADGTGHAEAPGADERDVRHATGVTAERAFAAAGRHAPATPAAPLRAAAAARFGEELLEAAPDAIVVVDESGRIRRVNAQSETLFGYRRDELVGAPVELLLPARFHDAHLTERSTYLAHPRRRTMGEGHDLLGRRKDGTEFAVDISLAPLRTAEGLLVLAAVRDVTERKRTGERLRQAYADLEREQEAVRALNTELEQRVVQRTAELVAATGELEAFAYSVSHDLRAPLRGIDGFSLALLEDHGLRLEPEAQRYLALVRESAQQMAQLIDDLLRLSLVSRGEMRREPVDLSTLAREILTELARRDPERVVACEVQGEVAAQGDPALLRAALQNLLDNAWKFTARQEGARIEFGRLGADGEPVYVVRDNGVGFDMTYAHKLFSPFQRLHSPREFPGTGIGLATVRRVIGRHGGRAWAESAVGQGAAFFFTLGPSGGS